MRKSVLIVLVFLAVTVNLIVLILVISARKNPVAALPTIAVLPSDTPAVQSPTPTDTVTVTATPSDTLTATLTETASPTVLPSLTASTTPSPTEGLTLTPTVPTPTMYEGSPLPVTIKIKEPAGTQARSGPGISYEVVGQAKIGSTYTVHAYARDFFGHVWYLVDLPDEKMGWILEPAAEVVSGIADRVALVATIPATPTLTPTLTLTPSSGLEARLQAVPVFSGIGSQLRDIYFKGQRAGNSPNSLVKIGDCNTEAEAFLMPIDQGIYRLGRYAFLQKIISHFKGSFGRNSIAADVGFNVVSVQDSMWSDRRYCGAEESPIACEYRLMKPSISVIMFGANDVTFLKSETYRKSLREIVEKTIDQGVIPILMTFTWHDRGKLYPKVLEFNMIVAELAEEYQVPLINFWLAAQYLPDHGIHPDNAHLSLSGNGLDFTGEQAVWGHTLRSLLVLEMLDEIQTELGR